MKRSKTDMILSKTSTKEQFQRKAWLQHMCVQGVQNTRQMNLKSRALSTVLQPRTRSCSLSKGILLGCVDFQMPDFLSKSSLSVARNKLGSNTTRSMGVHQPITYKIKLKSQVLLRIFWQNLRGLLEFQTEVKDSQSGERRHYAFNRLIPDRAVGLTPRRGELPSSLREV